MLIAPPLLVVSVMVGQLSVPFTSEIYRTSSCSTSNNTGYVPFGATLTCTTHPAKNGCVASGSVNLRAITCPGGTCIRPYLCSRPASSPLLDVLDAAIDLSGAQFDSVPVSQLHFKELQVKAAVTSFDPSTGLLSWQATVNWMDRPDAMVDQFTVSLFGEIVWTTLTQSQLLRGAATCSASSDTCTKNSSQSWTTGWNYGGTAISGLRISFDAPAGSPGAVPTELSSELLASGGTSRAKVATSCRVGGVAATTCSFDYLTIVGRFSEVSSAGVGPFSHTSNPAVQQGFNVPFYPIAAARCGLREFSSIPQVPAPVGRIWFGANNLDCGWSPGNVFTGQGLYGWEEPGQSARADTSFSLDATRLP